MSNDTLKNVCFILRNSKDFTLSRTNISLFNAFEILSLNLVSYCIMPKTLLALIHQGSFCSVIPLFISLFRKTGNSTLNTYSGVIQEHKREISHEI